MRDSPLAFDAQHRVDKLRLGKTTRGLRRHECAQFSVDGSTEEGECFGRER
jgi:hypothetical protein